MHERIAGIQGIQIQVIELVVDLVRYDDVDLVTEEPVVMCQRKHLLCSKHADHASLKRPVISAMPSFMICRLSAKALNSGLSLYMPSALVTKAFFSRCG